MDELQQLIDQAQQVTFLTGAGVSTASGIPDYRSKTGLYAGRQRPEELLSHDYFVAHPDKFWQFVKQSLYFPEAQPNIIHQKMAQIAATKGQVITQNIDGLDHKAGNQQVIEFHGNLYQTYCTQCQKDVPWQEYLADYRHPDCGGFLRPRIVLYGEGINEQVVQKSVRAIQQADVIIVVGTSFQVYPFAGLLQYRQPQAKLVAVNKTPLDVGQHGLMLTGDAAHIFAQLH
ncbi:NAD-dependent protein deacylase [Bombilactobacillus folatiphilus]|uniref:protein acetyllysine N-acetyltransferase n=1 Tax=Bombilactobacillus folatiphilus TaxID=2923362 RepID=A0ABY4P9J8_9LACO|nr:NAD-dependent protein deacylase [Bombilactobacillus folatiphilus]UQS82301.1 NAD-dependent protein deacylase [Bombilactobacillus folatiphilus]